MLKASPKEVVVYRRGESIRITGKGLAFAAPMLSALTGFLRATLRDLEEQRDDALHAVVLDATGIGQLDASAADALREVLDDYRSRGVRLYLAGVRGPVRDVLDRSGFTDAVGPDAYVLRVHHAVLRLHDDPPHAAAA